MLDPRHRAGGGLGARVIRARQERYMKLAWEQVGEVHRGEPPRRRPSLRDARGGEEFRQAPSGALAAGKRCHAHRAGVRPRAGLADDDPWAA